MITDITKQFSADLARKIFANKENAIKYLLILNEQKPVDNLFDKKNNVKKMSSAQLWGMVVETWDYQIAKPIIRNLFCQTAKYKRGKEANEAVALLRREWDRLNLGDFAWPFSQNDFDNFVQRINNMEGEDGLVKDEKVKTAAVKFRRIKEINTYRNDYIETLIFENSDAILPTLRHNRGVDFFINGISFDQKVSKSVTSEFKKDHGDNWRAKAIEDPLKVASYLYAYQNEGRFGADPRLLIAYVDDDVEVNSIEKVIANTDFYNPQTVKFSFKHKTTGAKSYSCPCIIILLHN